MFWLNLGSISKNQYFRFLPIFFLYNPIFRPQIGLTASRKSRIVEILFLASPATPLTRGRQGTDLSYLSTLASSGQNEFFEPSFLTIFENFWQKFYFAVEGPIDLKIDFRGFKRNQKITFFLFCENQFSRDPKLSWIFWVPPKGPFLRVFLAQLARVDR